MAKPKNVYIDASCIVELFAGQHKRKEVEKLLEEIAIGNYTGYISTLTLLESEKGLIEGAIEGIKGNPNKNIMLHILNEAHQKFIEQFQNLHTTSNIVFINLSRNDLKLAKRLCAKSQFLESIDAIHLAKCMIKKYELATFDSRLKSDARHNKVPVYF